MFNDYRKLAAQYNASSYLVIKQLPTYDECNKKKDNIILNVLVYFEKCLHIIAISYYNGMYSACPVIKHVLEPPLSGPG
jgi:hypothetical protein